MEWGTYSLPCSDPASWWLCQGEDSGKPPPLGSGSWVAPQWTKRELAGDGSAELGISSSDQIPFLCVAAGDWLVEGNPGTTVGLFCPCCFSRTSREVLGPWDGLLVEVEVGWELELGLPSLHRVFGLVWWLPRPPASFPKASLCSRRVLTHPLSILFLDFSP